MPISVKEAKQKASNIKERLNSIGVPVSHAQALEALAAGYGDATWAAMRARLTAANKPKPKQLQLCLYEVNLYANLHDGSLKYLDTRTVLCFNKDQAVAATIDSEFPPQYYSNDYAKPFTSLGEIEFFDEDTLPDMEFFCEWLSDVMRANSVACLGFWSFLAAAQGVTLGDKRATDCQTIRRAIEDASPNFTSAAQFFSQLYEALPDGLWYSAPARDYFGFEPEGLHWKNA